MHPSPAMLTVVALACVLAGAESQRLRLEGEICGRSSNGGNAKCDRGLACNRNVCKRVCPTDFLPYGEKCYQYVGEGQDWTQAVNHCQSLGGYMAEPKSASEYQYLKTLAKNNNATTDVYTGGKLIAGKWTWVRSNDVITYLPWSSGQPDGSGVCMSLWRGADYGLDDHICTDSSSVSVCEAAPAPTNKKTCEHNGKTYQDGERYKDDCNGCTCYDGQGICTAMGCGFKLPTYLTKAPVTDGPTNKKTCDHKGKTFQAWGIFMDGNKCCTCNSGHAICTVGMCHALKHPMPTMAPDEGPLNRRDDYSAGRPVNNSSKLDCKSCACIDHNHIMCHMMQCVQKEYKCPATDTEATSQANETSIETTSTATTTTTTKAAPTTLKTCEHKGKTYQPGERFVDDCNRCYCYGGTGIAKCSFKMCHFPKHPQITWEREDHGGYQGGYGGYQTGYGGNHGGYGGYHRGYNGYQGGNNGYQGGYNGYQGGYGVHQTGYGGYHGNYNRYQGGPFPMKSCGPWCRLHLAHGGYRASERSFPLRQFHGREVNGNWASWSSWSACSVKCGAGSRTRVRTCTNPPPPGADCVGVARQMVRCYTWVTCPRHGGYHGRYGRHQTGYGGYKGYKGGNNGYRGGYNGYQGGYNGYKGGYNGYEGGYNQYKGGNNGYRGGYNGYRGGYNGYKGGYNGSRGGYNRYQGGYNGYQGGHGGYLSGQSGYQGGHGEIRGGSNGHIRGLHGYKQDFNGKGVYKGGYYGKDRNGNHGFHRNDEYRGY